MQGFGFGGEWSVGAVLIAEMIQAKHRGKAVGLVQSSWAVGWGAAAIAFWAVYAVLPPEQAWRVLFWLHPAGFPDFLHSPQHQGSRGFPGHPGQEEGGRRRQFLGDLLAWLLKTTILASLLSTGMMGAYYAVTTWLPTFLKVERKLSALGTSGLLVLILGSFIGYLTSAFLSGQARPSLLLHAVRHLCRFTCVSLHSHPDYRRADALPGFPLGFFLSGIFSGMGAYLAELFPNELRGSGQGFCYNFGRRRRHVARPGRLPRALPCRLAKWDRRACCRRLPAGHSGLPAPA